MKAKGYKRIAIVACEIIAIGVGSNALVRLTSTAAFSVFDSTNLFTYFGVLIGFALTIYTFGLSMVSDIRTRIEAIENFTSEVKIEMDSKLVSGFHEIKGDIWLIFYSIIAVISFAILKGIQNPFGWNVVYLKIPETINVTLFVTSTHAMWDIMRTLFNLSEINLELNRLKKPENSAPESAPPRK
jgi:hypothetical protein